MIFLHSLNMVLKMLFDYCNDNNWQLFFLKEKRNSADFLFSETFNVRFQTFYTNRLRADQ